MLVPTPEVIFLPALRGTLHVARRSQAGWLLRLTEHIDRSAGVDRVTLLPASSFARFRSSALLPKNTSAWSGFSQLTDCASRLQSDPDLASLVCKGDNSVRKPLRMRSLIYAVFLPLTRHPSSELSSNENRLYSDS